VALVTGLANILTVVAAVLLCTGDAPWLFAAIVALKFVPDGYFLWHLSGYFDMKFNFFRYTISAVIYPFYLMISMARAFLVPVEWKGRGRKR
jgi:uncharacterized membrane protein YphA (DoxX/SURF4 family)